MACIRDYAFRMNVMEEIFEIRSCIEILANDIKSIQLISICSIVMESGKRYAILHEVVLDRTLVFDRILKAKYK